MKLYTRQEVLDNVRDLGLAFPFVIALGENLVFTQLYGAYRNMIQEEGMGNAYKQQCSFPVPNIPPHESTAYWIYIGMYKDNTSQLFFKTSNQDRMLSVVNQNWSPRVCRKLYMVDSRNKLVVQFSGTSLNSDRPSVPDHLNYR